MNYVTEIITPEKAKRYLNSSEGNRPISKAVVNTYADTMLNGNWMLNGMCIIFDDGGHLLDGHHRLHAVIKAGIPVRFNVCTGVDKNAFVTYDCGRHRNIAQLLAIQGVKNYAVVGSIVVAAERIKRSGRLYVTNAVCNGRSITNQEKYNLYQCDKEGYDEVAAIITRLMHKTRVIPGSWSGGLIYYLTHSGGYRMSEVTPFFEAIYDIEEYSIPVVTMFRNVVIKLSVTGKKIEEQSLWGLLVKAWNHFINGTTPKLLRFSKSVEDMPKLKLKGIL